MQEEDCGLARQAGGAGAPAPRWQGAAMASFTRGGSQRLKANGRSLQTDGRCKLKRRLFETEGRERTDPRDPRSALRVQ